MPAPADLVIYTNIGVAAGTPTSSRRPATTTCPARCEPVIRVENLSGSDHYSFWNYGYRAVTAIEDEAWGDDFCPWYHTCNDRIAQYPQDYVLNCAKANLAAVAETAVPINPGGPYLVLQSTAIDDDATPPSTGDDDGILNSGETVELWVTVRNVGNAPATSVTGTLGLDQPGRHDPGRLGALEQHSRGRAGQQHRRPSSSGSTATAPDGEAIPFTLDA